jgi:hypothetical protein
MFGGEMPIAIPEKVELFQITINPPEALIEGT